MTTKEQVKEYLLRLIARGEPRYATKAVETFGISKSTVYNYIREMAADHTVQKDEKGVYTLPTQKKTFAYSNQDLDESRIFQADILPLIRDLPQNVVNMWAYAFTEMMNNAIEHSEASAIVVTVSRDPLQTNILIGDNGVGIFQKIHDYLLTTAKTDLPLSECVNLLFTGKFTTNKEAHSGEGIFFTSHIMDSFFVFSDKLVFTRNNFSDMCFNFDDMDTGTTVAMQLANHSHKTSEEVFNRFTTPDEGFISTSVPIAHMFPEGFPVSRSEARRLGSMFLRFENVTLDFSGVSSIGQAFTHELFVVWQRKNQKIKLTYVGANENVSNMINRVCTDARKES